MGKEILLIIVNLMFSDLEILYARVQKLEWSHMRRVLSVTNAKARQWYLENASNKYVEWTDGGQAFEDISRSSLY